MLRYEVHCSHKFSREFIEWEGEGYSKSRWMRILDEAGLKPGIIKLDETVGLTDGRRLEKAWTEIILQAGGDLLQCEHTDSYYHAKRIGDTSWQPACLRD
jgi:hypothetical protein